MEVTAARLPKLLPEILKAIAAADLVAFDLELTGLHTSSRTAPRRFDPPSLRYAKTVDSAVHLATLQWGLAILTWNSAKSRYDARNYVFPTFPRHSGSRAEPMPDTRFLCQASSITFLTEHKFDFNKCFYESVPWLTRPAEARRRRKLEEEQAKRLAQADGSSAGLSGDDGDAKDASSMQRVTITSPRDQEFVDKMLSKVRAWHAADDSKTTPLELEPVNGYRRRLTYEALQAAFVDIDIETVRPAQGEQQYHKKMRLTRMSPEQLIAVVNKRHNEALSQLEEQIGFRHVLEAVCKSPNLVVVGHNMLLDLFHTYQQFIDPDMPSTAAAFKISVTKLFPRLLDTKWLVKSHPALSELFDVRTSLGELFAQTSEPDASRPVLDVVPVSDQFVYAKEKPHDAGFDAFMTACVAVRTLSLLVPDLPSTIAAGNPSAPLMTLAAPYMNRIHMMSCDYAFHTAGADDVPLMENVVWLHDLPADWGIAQVRDAVQAAKSQVVAYQWVEDSALGVLVQVPDGPSLLAAVQATAAQPPTIKAGTWQSFEFHCASSLAKDAKDSGRSMHSSGASSRCICQ